MALGSTQTLTPSFFSYWSEHLSGYTVGKRFYRYQRHDDKIDREKSRNNTGRGPGIILLSWWYNSSFAALIFGAVEALERVGNCPEAHKPHESG